MQVLTRKDKALAILKSVWARRDGSKWQNIGNGIEPYNGGLKIPNHIPTEDESGSGDSIQNDRERLEQLLHSEPINVSGFSSDSNLKQHAWTAFVKARNSEIRTNDGKLITLSNKGFKKVLSHSANPLVLHLFSEIKALVESSIFLFQQNKKPKINVEHYESRGVKIDYKSQKYYVRLLFRKEKGKLELFHYDQNITSENEIKRALDPNPYQQTKPGERDKMLYDENLVNWIKLSIQKSFLGFGVKPSSNGKVGLIKKVITDKNGRRQTKWVRPEEPDTPKEKKQAEAKAQRKQFRDLPKHSPEDQKKVEEILQRHKDFEVKAKEQRRVYGPGPMLPKPGLIMRVYAKGKVNVGGMLAEIKQVANDGKTVIAQLTSGKTYSFPLDQLQFAKSILQYEVGKIHEQQVGSPSPQFLGDATPKGIDYTTKVLDSLTSNRSDAQDNSRIDFLKSQLKKIAVKYEELV